VLLRIFPDQHRFAKLDFTWPGDTYSSRLDAKVLRSEGKWQPVRRELFKREQSRRELDPGRNSFMKDCRGSVLGFTLPRRPEFV
jgi:hypothetical protein